MKKLLFAIPFLLLLSAMSYDAKSQVSFSQTASNPTGAISNSSTDTMTYSLTKGYSRVLFCMTYTRSAGTAAGTVILEYRMSSSDNWNSDAGDTLTITNAASKSYYWNKTVPARHWRMRVGGATTVTATAAAKLNTD